MIYKNFFPDVRIEWRDVISRRGIDLCCFSPSVEILIGVYLGTQRGDFDLRRRGVSDHGFALGLLFGR